MGDPGCARRRAQRAVHRAARAPPAGAVKILTAFTVVFLLLNAVLLGWAGLGMHRPWLVVAASVCVAVTFLVIVAARRYRRIVAELQGERRGMKREVEALREVVRHPKVTPRA